MSLTSPPVTASGGDTVQDIGGYRIHTFTTVGTSSLVVTRGGPVEVLVIAGGGGGAGNSAQSHPGGGGGAGELIYNPSFVISGTVSVTVGAGGAGEVITPFTNSLAGSNSSLGSLTANGGGRGGHQNENGGAGGSGGGGGRGFPPGGTTGGASTRTIGFGNAGGGSGSDLATNSASAGGGGGAGGPGRNSYDSSKATEGGPGFTYTISGSAITYAAGGSGGSRSDSLNGVSGAANTGSGGGGGGGSTGVYTSGGSGGSGIVIVRYPLGTLTAGPQPQIFLGPLLSYPASTGTPPTSDGTKISFARASSQFLNYGSQTFDMTKGFCVTCKFAFTSTVGNWERLIDFGSGQGVDNILLTRQSSNGVILFSYRNGGTEYLVFSTNTVAQDQINTVTAIYTHSPLAVTIILNGVTTTSTPAVAASTPRTLSICYVGRSHWSGDAYLNGDIYSLNIYNRVLTSSELVGPVAPSPWSVMSGTPLFSQISQSAASSAVGAFSLRAVNGVSTKAVQVRPQGQFPATGFTSAVTNPGGNQYNQTLNGYPFGGAGVYTSNCSSWAFFDGNIPGPWKAFDYNTGTWWENNYGADPGYNLVGATGTSNAYSGAYTTTVSGSSIGGEWIQLGLPTSIVLYSYSMYSRAVFSNGNRMPYQWVVAGSNDGTTWTTVDSQTGITWTGATQTFTTSSVTAYLYFRLVVRAIQTGGASGNPVNIGQWTLNGTPSSTTTDFYADQRGNLLTSPVIGQTMQGFLGEATGYITKWYDQSGAGNDVSQAVAANQPSITTGGAIVFSGAQSFSNTATTGGCLAASAGTKTKYSYGAVWNPSSLSGYQSVCEHNASTGITSKRSSLLLNNTNLGFNGQNNDIQGLIGGLVTGTQYSTVARIDNTDAGYAANGNKNVRMRQNGVDYSGATNSYAALDLDNYQFIIGKKANVTGEFFNGSMKSIMVFKDVLSDADTALLQAWQQSI